MFVNSGAVVEAGASVRANSASSGSGISGAFMETLNRQMRDWISTLKDNKITEGETNYINSLGANPSGALDDLTEEEQGNTLYEGSAAQLYTSVKINEISNLMSWMFKYLTIEKELNDKIASALSG